MTDPQKRHDPLRPEVAREQITPTAREPREDATGVGFGSHYPGPLVQTEDRPLADPTAPQYARESTEPRPRTTALASDENDQWEDAEARDFRSDDEEPELIPPTEDPSRRAR